MSVLTATGRPVRARLAPLGSLQRRLPALQLIALAALFAYGATTVSGFSEGESVRSMLVLAALLGLSATGQTLCILIGALDLSVPGMIVLGAAIITQLCGGDGWSFGPALILIIALCALTGTAIGWACHRYRTPPIIVTLAASFLALGAVQVWTHAEIIASPPAFLSTLVAADGTTFGLPVAPIVMIWLAVAVAMAVLLHRTVAGRHLYATGANVRAAELALINTRRVWAAVFCASLVLSGLTGVLLAGFAGANTSLGQPYLFQGLTAVILGGTEFAGRRGDYTNTVIGALILTELSTILVGRGYDTGVQQIIFGGMLLLVVAGYGRGQRLSDRL